MDGNEPNESNREKRVAHFCTERIYAEQCDEADSGCDGSITIVYTNKQLSCPNKPNRNMNVCMCVYARENSNNIAEKMRLKFEILMNAI